MMKGWQIAALVFGCGGVGGFVNALLADNLHLPHREDNLYSPGWVGNVIIGAVAALVFWMLYGPAKASLPLDDLPLPTLADFAGFIVTGIGGGRILSNEVEKKALTKARDTLADAVAKKNNG